MPELPLTTSSELEITPLPQATAAVPATSAALVEANQPEFAELVTFIDFAKGLTIGFVEVNQEQDKSLLVAALRQHLGETNIHLEVINFSRQPDLRYLLDALQERLAKLHTLPNADQKLVLFIQGLEAAIGTDGVGAHPPLLQDLNFVRDAYRQRVPHPLLFVLPDYALTRVSKYAPDFWAWQSGLFRFKTPLQTVEQLKADIPNRPLPYIASAENQAQIEQLKQLLMELNPSGKLIAPQDLPLCCELYYKIGSAYYTQKQPDKAKDYLGAGLKLLHEHPNPTLARDFHRKLGHVYEDLRQFEAAIAEYTTALEIANTHNHSASIATLFHDLGDVALAQRQWDQANDYYQQALEIKIEFGESAGADSSVSRYSQASTLHQLGRVAEEQRQYDQANAYYQQALEIKIEFGDRYSQASTYGQLGLLYQETRDWKNSHEAFHKALEIHVEFNDKYSQAQDFHNLGIVTQEQRQWQQANDYYQQALAIYIEFGDRYEQADTLHQLGQVGARAAAIRPGQRLLPTGPRYQN